MFDANNPLVTWMAPCGGTWSDTYDKDMMVPPVSPVAKGVDLYSKGDHKAACDIWRAALSSSKGDELSTALRNLGTCYASGEGAPEDWSLAHNYLHKSALRGNAGGAYNCALLGMRSPKDPRALIRFDRTERETLALLICAREFGKGTMLPEHGVAPLEEHVRRVYPHVLVEAEKLAATMIKEARIYSPAAA